MYYKSVVQCVNRQRLSSVYIKLSRAEASSLHRQLTYKTQYLQLTIVNDNRIPSM